MAVAYWMIRREEARARRQYLRDWDEALLEEEARRASAQKAAEQAARLRLLGVIASLTYQIFELFKRLHPRPKESDHWHIGYLGGPVNKYLYMTPSGEYTIGYEGTDSYDFAGLTSDQLRQFSGTLRVRLAELEEQVAAMDRENERARSSQ